MHKHNSGIGAVWIILCRHTHNLQTMLTQEWRPPAAAPQNGAVIWLFAILISCMTCSSVCFLHPGCRYEGATVVQAWGDHSAAGV